MDPITALAIGGGALGVASSISAGKQAAAMGNYNAGLQRAAAYETLRATVQREDQFRESANRDLASQRAALSANGIDPSSGTALLGVAQSMRDAEMDALMLRYEGVLEGRNQFLGAAATKAEGQMRKSQAYLSAAGQLVSAAGSYMGRPNSKPGFSGTQAPAPVETRTPSIVRPFG